MVGRTPESREAERPERGKVMKKYIVQYSYPSGNRIAVSDWLEKQTVVEAPNLTLALGIFNKKHQNLGTWMILDCYPASEYDLNFNN
jgi:hypothetical protein